MGEIVYNKKSLSNKGQTLSQCVRFDIINQL